MGTPHHFRQQIFVKLKIDSYLIPLNFGDNAGAIFEGSGDVKTALSF
jgi:hypothetical protein